MKSRIKKQFMWEVWMAISIVLFFSYIFVGLLPGSKETFPNWLPWFLGSIINLQLAIIFGLVVKSDE